VLPRTGEPGAGIGHCRHLVTVGQVNPLGWPNERPNGVLRFDDDIGDDVGALPIDALNRW
jgi:hypothetical protein